MKNKTVVEWLVNELNQKIDFIPMDKWDMIRDIVQQAKEIEKEQIKDAYKADMIPMSDEDAEQYYIENYG